MEIFTTNLRIIQEHNAGRSSFKLGVNVLADLSAAEYRELLAPAGRVPGRPRTEAAAGYNASGVRAGDSKDWRDEGAVTSVRSRQGCGSGSWAFAAAAAVESAWQIAGNSLVELSDQQLLDCSVE